MKMNVLLFHPQDWFGNIVDHIGENNPGLYITENFTQVMGMIEAGEVERILILFAVANFSGPGFLANGKIAAEKIHEKFPDIPIMIWNGRNTRTNSKGECEYRPIKYKNEIYISNDSNYEDVTGSSAPFYEALQKFFEGTFSIQDNVVEYLGHDCLKIRW
jgi:hypothetical protein